MAMLKYVKFDNVAKLNRSVSCLSPHDGQMHSGVIRQHAFSVSDGGDTRWDIASDPQKTCWQEYCSSYFLRKNVI
ncbi:hypothetical protein D6833_06730 [Candidatus Parcubacteria bacterium]|nr:MAG: hypothetical protein D6833_06730 [Candidatus Parcubacteria bacterium]